MSKPLNSFLDSNSPLHHLSREVQLLGALQRAILSTTPRNWAGHFTVVRLHQGQVLLDAANNALAAKMRQLTPDIVASLQQKGFEVTGIQIRVQVTQAPPLNTSTPRHLSPQAQQTLDTFSSALQESPLKLALRKLLRQR